MSSLWPQRLFVTGTDTEVGKTLVCAALLASEPAFRYWKPVQSGAAEGTDTAWIRQATSLPEDRFCPEHTVLRDPVSPHIAAAREGLTIDLETVCSPELAPGTGLFVEGAGGVMVPLNEKATMLDLMVRLAVPVLVVARPDLGTINHTLLSIQVLRQAGLGVWGVVFSGEPEPEVHRSVKQFGRLERVASLPWVEECTFEALAAQGKRLAAILRGRT